jgi:2-polyprenyl-6-methoxyphenol hydroxylase-like FAD-dependent oxidoreductase
MGLLKPFPILLMSSHHPYKICPIDEDILIKKVIPDQERRTFRPFLKTNQMQAEPTESSPNPKIVIIGSGITGLLLFHLLSKSHQPVLYTAEHEIVADKSPYIILWKSAIKVLLKLGFGKRLSTISFPLLHIKSSEVDLQEVLVDFKPEKTDGIDEYKYLPPAVTLRRVDLLRMLLIALTDQKSLVLEPDSQLLFKPSTNNPDPQTGMASDFAYEGWFEIEGYSKLANINWSHCLESYRISSQTGLVSLTFTNGHVDTCDLLLGADGADSVVRSLLSNRIIPTLTKQVLIMVLHPLKFLYQMSLKHWLVAVE